MAKKFMNEENFIYAMNQLKSILNSNYASLEYVKNNATKNYNDLINKPVIPTVTNDLTNELKANYDMAHEYAEYGLVKMNCIDGFMGELLVAHHPSDGPNAVFYSTKLTVSSSGSLTSENNINAKAFSEDGVSLVNKYATIANVLIKDNSEAYIPTSDYNPATKKYVDDSIVKDYNDLDNRPCYDERIYNDVVIEYDGVLDGKVTGAVPALGVSKLVKVADLTEEQYNNFLVALKKGYTVTVDDGSGNITTVEGSDYDEFMYGAVYINNTAVVVSVQAFSMSIGHATNHTPEPGVYFNADAGETTIKLELQVPEGDFKILDSKYLVNSPGIKVEEGKEIIVENESYTVYLCAEIFNDYQNNIATGRYSHAEGSGTKALGDFSHAEGGTTTTKGTCSHAEGRGCYAEGDCSHAEGNGAKAYADYSHAEGSSQTHANYSHAEGSSKTYAIYSHAEGYKTTASSKYQHVQGRNNIVDEENRYAHIVGNGSDDYGADPSNAHTLDWDGNAWYAGNVFVGANNKQLATQEYVNNKASYQYVCLEDSASYTQENIKGTMNSGTEYTEYQITDAFILELGKTYHVCFEDLDGKKFEYTGKPFTNGDFFGETITSIDTNQGIVLNTYLYFSNKVPELKVKIYSSVERNGFGKISVSKIETVSSEFLETYRFATIQEKENWNNKQSMVDDGLDTDDKTIVGAINELAFRISHLVSEPTIGQDDFNDLVGGVFGEDYIE